MTFEKFLIQYWSEHDGQCVLDDDQPDAYDDWVSMLECWEIEKYAEEYGKYMYLQGMSEGVRLIKLQMQEAI